MLAQVAVGEGGKGCHHGGIGLRGGNHLQQPHIARRIEEVRPEETLPVREQACGNLRNRQAGGVGGEHGLGRKMRRHAGQQGCLDGQIFGHRFDHPVTRGQFAQVVFKVARRHQRG